MEKRLLLAFLLMGAVLFLTPYFYKHVAPPAPARPTQTQTQAPAPTPAKAPEAASAVEPTASKTAAVPQVTAQKEEQLAINTNLYHIVLSNRGAVVRSWVLKKYKDSAGNELELVSSAGAPKTGYPFSLEFKDKKPPVDVNQALFVAKPDAGGLGIDFDYSDGSVVAHKSFRFDKDSYLSHFSWQVAQNGAALPSLIEWRGGFGDASVEKAASTQRTLYLDVESGKLVTRSAQAAKNGPVTDSGTYSFAGLEDTYFAAVFLPAGSAPLELETLSDTVPSALDAAKEELYAGAAVGGAAMNRFSVFVGPKDIDILRKIDPKLEQMVDFGHWLGWLAKPLFLIVNWINDHWTNRWKDHYGWAIVIVTIIINFAFLPLKLSSMKSMKKMQALKPQIDAINAKYKNVGLRDPRKAEQNAEVMELYKKHGANPMGGCLPMVLQIPFFFAFYTVLKVAIEMRGASWLWVTDLSQPEHLPIHILPILMIVAQFVMQKMTPNPSVDPNQQKMMMFMPLIFGFMFYNIMSGLVLYWLTSNLVGIGQQWFINKTMPITAPPPPPEPAATKRGKPSRSRR